MKTIPPAGTVIMNCTIHEAEIVLIEDAVNLENSQALILSFNVDLKANPDCKKQNIVGGIRNLQIISTYYLESKRDQAPYQKRKINRNKHWWFNALNEKQEDFECAVDVAAAISHEQQATITMESLIVTLEAGVGNRTVPVVLLESSTMISATQWSTLLAVDADVQFQVSYYNETFCVWEPIVEPVEVRDNTWKSWLRTHNEDELSLNGALPLPQRTVNMNASELLNITITKSLILLSYNLMDSFERAAKLISPPMVRTFPGNSKYLILNNAGISTKVGNTETVVVSVDGQPVDVTPCTFVDLSVPVDSTEKIETKVENMRRLIYLHSIVQFVNHLDIPFEIHSMCDGRLDFCGIAETNSEPLDIPLPLLYTATGELFIRPSRDDAYEMSNESVCWNKFEDKARYIVRCDLSEDMKQGLFIALIVEEVPLKAERSRCSDDSSYTVHIFSPLTLHNFLPFPLRLTFPIQKELSGGEEVSLNVIPGQNLNFEVDYRGDTYVAEMLFPVERQDLMVTTLTSDEKILNLGVHWTVAHRKLDAEVYAPYWFVNNTGRTVKFAVMESNEGIIKRTAKCVPCQKSGVEGQYCDATMQEPFSEPVLLALDAKDFYPKKARLSLFGSYWTNEFPLDAVGNAGRIGCKDENNSEQSISLQISVCQSGLTKVITFLPFYLLHNESRFPLEIREFGAQNWVLVTPQTCIGFWPLQKENPKYAVVRYGDTVEESILFPITESFDGFCKIDNDYLGVYVTVTVCESSSIIKLESFEPGARSMKTLAPWESCAFTWTDVIRDRALEWKSGDATNSNDLIRNAFEDYKTSKSDSSRYYWGVEEFCTTVFGIECVRVETHFYVFFPISFLDGRQRIYLFTDDVAVMTAAYQAHEIELPILSFEISLQGIGISIVDNFKTEEIAYSVSHHQLLFGNSLSKTDSSLPFTVKQMEIIEHAYQSWLPDPSEETVIVDKLEFDFTHMKLRKYKNWRMFRLTSGDNFKLVFGCNIDKPSSIALSYETQSSTNRQSTTSMRISCVLSVVPPPKSEFAVQVDQGFVNAMLELISSQANNKPYTKETFVKDFEMTKNQLEMIAGMTMASQQTSYYESLHISPLMIHLSFSQGGSSGGKRVKDKVLESKEAIQVPPIQSEFVNVFLKSIGVTVTEIQDVIFKLAFFERKYAFYTISQLQGEITGHYTSQIIKQLYVLVLGLDILGNPFGLVRDLSSGVQDFFYQPFQGAVQGPEEFAEGVALGIKGLVGATVGGGVGAVSRIAGTLGKGVAALTLDEEYQRKRQQMMNRRPKTIGEGVARGAKGVGQGLYEGVAGVVSKPLAGARSGGAGGFAKGLSLGLVGIITRPLSGAVDFASSTLDAVRSATVGMDEMKPLRPSRVIFSDNIVRPYSQKIAIGAQIFREADNGSVADTDYFLAHAPISEKSIFIITDRRAMNVRKSDMVGSWNIEWQVLYTEMNRPTLSDKTILIDLRKKQKEIYNKLLVAYEVEVGDG
ncbi:Vacuolar protein sorting-associated protein 13A [Dirofilaria immitis]|nr:Vacuolar protein sorting-associated protein 13A [Dirofilaria immitis]